ncbi:MULTISPECIES: class I SAM-dependent methyltransferase [Streptomyces]|uniref:Methyltransferase n=1 Tax=Streptomyces griseus subsp. griseus (strain JCM 4626 / CBS 651.72 / NBRC 13350 / KCC S-0626 / ISP 5235) TaxID=455632 RepID=B1W5N4_STRGG|nr:class I SAM-dependent methyltransferase [Streptomyces griseus]MYR09818.1 methyltransferase domain-containing protein [Streptomyces sp. SID724]MBW3708937.1 class I SAM-dependent methyltransferase [Streptomyces griseus]NEB52919.1 class I SAM-dependent methyltransferase [Streptomyces griseus]SEE39219.1 Methyltransferase domain-containing protein [Streptomyces griseus]SQA21401.1 methyltransferase [Streptomyces griseus]
MSEPTVYDAAAIDAYDLISSMLSPGAGLAAWVSSHRPLAGRTVLDLGAGTGVSSFALADAGAQVVAVDASRPSLDLLESRRGERKVDTVEADFRDLRLDSAFDVVTMSKNTFFLAQSHDEKIELLRAIGRHLKPGGAVFLDCTDPVEYLRADGAAHTVTYPLGREQMVTITQNADRATQAIMSIFMVQSASTLTSFHEMATWASLPEIRLLARAAGLEVTAVDGSYAGDAYTARSREMLVVLEAK